MFILWLEKKNFGIHNIRSACDCMYSTLYIVELHTSRSSWMGAWQGSSVKSANAAAIVLKKFTSAKHNLYSSIV